jgi:hypothetical protein
LLTGSRAPEAEGRKKPFPTVEKMNLPLDIPDTGDKVETNGDGNADEGQ